jgi:hypothetical protein
MARQRNPSGAYSPSSAGIGQQIMYTPEWADIDFADFQGLNMNLINQNAQFAQEVANKRLDEVLKQRNAILEKVKLHKRFDDLQGQLDNKLGSIIDNMGQLQLSDSANFTSLNTSLIKAQNDPVLQSAVNASTDAIAYEKMKFEKPEIADQPWNNANENSYQRFLRGETNDFSLNPIYKEYDLQTKADEFAKAVPADVQNAIVKYGVYGLQEKAIEDKSAGRLLKAFNDYKQGLMQDPEFMSWAKRRGAFEEKRGSSIDNVINNIFKSSAAKYGTTTPTVKVSMPSANPDINVGINLSENARAQARFEAEKDAGFPSLTGKSKAEKEPDNFIDYGEKIIKKRGAKLTPDEKAEAVKEASKIFKGYTNKKGQFVPYDAVNNPIKYYVKDNAGNLLNAPPEIVGPPGTKVTAFEPTGKFEKSDKGVLIEFSNGPVKKYRQVSQEFFEKAIGASEYSADGTTTTPTGNEDPLGLGIK